MPKEEQFKPHDYSDHYYLGDENQKPHHDESIATGVRLDEFARCTMSIAGNFSEWLVRLFSVNPNLAARMLEVAEKDPNRLRDHLLADIGPSRKIASFTSISLARAIIQTGDVVDGLKEVERIVWSPGVDINKHIPGTVVVIRMENQDGKNYRLEWKIHEDPSSSETEAVLYEEDIAITLFEISVYS